MQKSFFSPRRFPREDATVRSRSSRIGKFFLGAFLFVCLTQGYTPAQDAPVTTLQGQELKQLLATKSVPLSFRATAAGLSGRAGSLGSDLAAFDGSALVRRPDSPGSALLNRYHTALQRESRRALEKDPSIFWGVKIDEEGYPQGSVRREATRIFSGANNRVMSQLLETMLRDTKLGGVRQYVEGIRLDVLHDGGVKMGAGGDDAGQNVKASVGLIALGSPRVELRTTLPGAIRARVEVPLISPGIRASVSRKLANNVRGTLSGGYEDSGDDRWVSAGLEIRF